MSETAQQGVAGDFNLVPRPKHTGTKPVAQVKAEIRLLWMTPLSTRQIAEQIGVTKNVVVGHVTRMGDLPRRPSPIARGRPRKDRVAPRAPLLTLPPLPSIAEPVAPRIVAPVVARPKPAPKPIIARPRVPAQPRRAINPVPAEALRQKNGACRFPLWSIHEAPTHVYCDKPAAGSWCDECRKRVFIRVAVAG